MALQISSTHETAPTASDNQILHPDVRRREYPSRPASPLARLRNGIVVFSGGSAANSLVEVFEHVRQLNGCSLSYVIPISDNGGSSSEIIRVFGGPGESSASSRALNAADDNRNRRHEVEISPPHPR